MITNSTGKGVICFTNPQQLPFIRQHGVYGNRSGGGRITRFGKLKDLFVVNPGDTLFLFETVTSNLYGAWTVQDDPIFSTSSLFDPSDSYPYRLRLQRHIEFPHPVPILELRRLLDRGSIWSIRSFERDVQGAFSSVNPISRGETLVLMELLYRYNHNSVLTSSFPLFPHATPSIQQNFWDLANQDVYESPYDRVLTADALGTSDGSLIENALHCLLAYNLTRRAPALTGLFGEYDQVLREVPVSTTGQHKADFLLIYENPLTNHPTVYSLVEVKRDSVSLEMLRQLIEYLKLFGNRLGVDSSSVEGVYIASRFDRKAIKYACNRAKVETERPLRLLSYTRTGNAITLEEVT